MLEFVIIGLILLLLYCVWNNNEHLTSPKNLTDDQINAIIGYIQKAIRINQQYGNFNQAYGYDISPWQFKTLVSLSRSGKLTLQTAKSTLNS